MNGQGSHDMHYYGTAAPGKQQKPSFSGRYVPPSMRNRTQQQLSAAPATSQQGRFPVHNGNQQQTSAAPVASQQVEFAVQLFPDMTSLKLAQQTDQHGSLTAFSGRPPPDYHSETAIHDYIAHISPDSAAAFGADVWLDTLHTTVGEFWLPMDKVADFKRMINAACSKLPSVAGIEYTTTELRHSVKRERRKKEIKGIHFYHLGLQASGQLQATLQPWITALQNIAVKIGAKLVLAPFLEHHITIRCHTIEPVPRVVFHQVVQAVHNSPLCIRVAGIRVQLAASVAFERFGAEHVATHIQSDASEVRYPKPAFTSGEAASVLVERAWARQQFGEVQAEAVGVAANIAAAAVADDAAFLASKIQNLSITST